MSKPTQAQLAEFIGVSKGRVSQLVKDGVIPWPISDIATGVQAYCRHLREVAAGRRGGGQYDLAAERARLAARQADLAEIRIKTEMGRLVPVDWYLDAIRGIAAVLHSRMRRLSYLVQQFFPGIGMDEFDRWLRDIREEIGEAAEHYLNQHFETLTDAQQQELSE